jgi:hypothetical protein
MSIRRSMTMLAAVPALLLPLSGCEDDSNPATPDEGSQVGGIGSDVDDVTGQDGDGTGTLLPATTDPDATPPPNPNAGQGDGTQTQP